MKTLIQMNKREVELFDINLKTMTAKQLSYNSYRSYELSEDDISYIIANLSEKIYDPDGLRLCILNKNEAVTLGKAPNVKINFGEWRLKEVIKNDDKELILNCVILGYDSNGNGIVYMNKKTEGIVKTVLEDHSSFTI